MVGFKLNFQVERVDVGFREQFFEYIGKASGGTFLGSHHATLKKILDRQDFNTEDGID